jgi:hypothetical protein
MLSERRNVCCCRSEEYTVKELYGCVKPFPGKNVYSHGMFPSCGNYPPSRYDVQAVELCAWSVLFCAVCVWFVGCTTACQRDALTKWAGVCGVCVWLRCRDGSGRIIDYSLQANGGVFSTRTVRVIKTPPTSTLGASASAAVIDDRRHGAVARAREAARLRTYSDVLRTSGDPGAAAAAAAAVASVSAPVRVPTDDKDATIAALRQEIARIKAGSGT